MRKFDKEKLYFTSDLHFGHDNKIIWGQRGFSSIEEHDETLIKNWNDIIKDDDIVFVLGDLMMNGDQTEKIKRLNGTINIILGNHDLAEYKPKLYAECPNVDKVLWAEVIKSGDREFYLSHHPTLLANYDEVIRAYNLHGHLHRSVKFTYDNCYNINPEGHEFKPVSVKKILRDIKEREKV